MSTIEYILLFTFLGSFASLIGGFVLLAKKDFAQKVSHFLTSFAAGTLLGSVFFDLLPEASHEAEDKGIDIFFWTILGIVIFFFLGRTLHWFHHHEEHVDHKHRRGETWLIIIGDTLHNFLDGIVIAMTFLVSVPLGIVTTFAVAAHEIPQEIGDFGLLLHRGFSRKHVIIINIISAGFAFLGVAVALTVGQSIEGSLPIFLALTAGFFLFISLSDILPGIEHEKRRGHVAVSGIMFLLGIAIVWLSVSFLHHG